MMDASNRPTAPEPLDSEMLVTPDTPAARPPGPAPDFQAVVRHLATLPLQHYETCRKAEARGLGVRPTMLDGEVKRARAAAAALAAPPPPEPPGAADLALAAVELAGLDAATSNSKWPLRGMGFALV